MEIQKFKEISNRVYNSIQSFLPSDIEVMKNILALDSIKYGRIRTFSLENSQKIILMTLKQNCLILIKFLVENQIELPDELFDKVIHLLFAKNVPKPQNNQPINNSASQNVSNIAAAFQSAFNVEKPSPKEIDIQAQMEKERIERQIFFSIVDILYMTEYYNDELRKFIESRNVPDDISVNFALLVECEFKSFELTVLNKLMVGPVLLNLIQSYKKAFRKIVKSKIINELTKTIEKTDRNIVFEIFYILNDKPNTKLLKEIKSENTPEYIAFVTSLIGDKESSDIAIDKLHKFYEDMEGAITVLVGSAKHSNKKLQPRDEVMFIYLLESINKLLKYKSLNFFKLLQGLQALLKMNLDKRIKGSIYDILSFYVCDKDVYIEKILDCKEDIEIEIRKKDFYLLPKVIKFLNSYSRREALELSLLEQGKSLGSPYINIAEIERIKSSSQEHNPIFFANGDLNKSLILSKDIDQSSITYKTLGLRSEDPATVIECLNMNVGLETLKLNASHLRNAMIKDIKVIEKILEYQIEHKVVIEDLSIVNLLICMPNPRFFEYTKLFKDFSIYLNGDVLERINDNPESGIEWLNFSYNSEIGSFILRNCGYFNEILKNNKHLQNDLLPIYEKILEDNISSAQILLENITEDVQIDTFVLFEDENSLPSEIFFRVFAKQLLYAKFVKNSGSERFILKKKYPTESYIPYLKAKIVAGLDISSDIQFLQKNLLNTDELLGYLKVTDKKFSFSDQKIISSNILLNFGAKDSSYFLKYFPSANSDFEKFLLLFSIDKVDKDIECIIKEEIMKNIKSNNKLYLRMCIIQLLKCKDLDNILKILEKEYDDKQLLIKLNIQNVINGGKYCSKALISLADAEVIGKALFLLYYRNIWDKDYIIEMASKMDPDSSEELRYLMLDIKKY